MKKALFLFDTTGYAAEPFTLTGWETIIVDILNTNERAKNMRATHVLDWNILEREDILVSIASKCSFVFGFPPCTDLAVSGARHFEAKLRKDPNCQVKAVHLAQSVQRIAEKANVPWALENPISRLSSLWRKPDYIFHPWHYAGYLPENDKHPDYPAYIVARDLYPKQTCLWMSIDFRLPKRKPIPIKAGYSKQFKLLGGKSMKTKIIRSASPRGFFVGLAQRYNNEEGGLRMIERGDEVYHRPSGETWVVKAAGVDWEGEYVEPAGWPPCRARAADCDLIEKGKHLAFLAECAPSKEQS